MKGKVLYISYDGLTDPLGQSQIIPYLEKLSDKGYQITVLSTEKKEVFNNRKDIIKKILDAKSITWEKVFYTKKPPIISTLKDIKKLKRKAKSLHKIKNFDIIHCRSYISAFVGLYLKQKFNTKFVFDMRGFYADERVDGKIWNRSNAIFNRVYKFFKKKEKLFLENSDYTISLTNSGKSIIETWDISNNLNIKVIPCCADLDHFNKSNIDNSLAEKFRNELNIEKNDFVLTYLGSIGTWYMLDEMMEFFSCLIKKKENAKFLFISRDSKELIINSAKKYNIPEEKIIIRGANREDLPSLLSLTDISIFFIKPLFSKKASSPTKMAELLGMEIPIICNSNVGDVDEVINEGTGVLVNSFNKEEYSKIIENIDTLLKIPKEKLSKTADKYFSLQQGVEKYSEVYTEILSQ